MNSNDITIDQLEALAEILDSSCQTIRRCRLKAENGDLGPDEAILTVRDVTETINTFICPIQSD